jgi:hypothetical protein
VTAALARVAARPAARCERVFGDRVIDAEAARWAAGLDAGFLAEVGWDPTLLVLFPPAAHPLLGRPVCRAPGCATTAPARDRLCQGCRRRLSEQGLSLAEVERLPTLSAADARSAGAEECSVVACRRARRHRDGVYCEAHQQRWRAARGTDPDLNERRWRPPRPRSAAAARSAWPAWPRW